MEKHVGKEKDHNEEIRRRKKDEVAERQRQRKKMEKHEKKYKDHNEKIRRGKRKRNGRQAGQRRYKGQKEFGGEVLGARRGEQRQEEV